MKIITESVSPQYTLIERKVIQIKTKLLIPEQKLAKYATGLAISGEHKGNLVLYMSYDQIEIDSFEKKLVLVPTLHVICQVEPEEHEEAVDPYALPVKKEPWLNLKD